MSWSDLNQRITQLQQLPNAAVEALCTLFNQTQDGHVAFCALGEAFEASGDTETALQLSTTLPPSVFPS